MFSLLQDDLNLKDRGFGELPRIHGTLRDHANPRLRFVIGVDEQGWSGNDPVQAAKKAVALGAGIKATMASIACNTAGQKTSNHRIINPLEQGLSRNGNS
jgi:hypothetical protein